MWSKMVELEWAYDKNLKLIHINDFTRLEKDELKPFYCRLCFEDDDKHKEVIARKGNIRQHHFALKNHIHAPETIAHSNAKDDVYRLLKSHLEKNETFYAGINLDDGLNSQSINIKRKIQRINILRNISDVIREKGLENGRRPDISLLNKDGKAIRAIEIVVSNAPDDNKIKDLTELGIELIILKLEPPDWIKSKLNDQTEIKFNIKKSEIHNPSLPACTEQIGDAKSCIGDDEIRLHCFVRNDNKDKIFDFEKCPTYLKQDDRRCSLLLASGNKCNRVLLKTEKEYCETCEKIFEISKHEKSQRERLEQERKENEIQEVELEKNIPLPKTEFVSADMLNKAPGNYINIKIKNLNLPTSVKNFYINSGITDLYPPQADAIKAGILEGKNLLAAIPTASGKTLLAEFAMLRSILDENKPGKAIYIVPLRALASEKYENFLKFESILKSNGKGITTGIATGDFDSRDDWLGKFDIIVATSEKVDSLLRIGSHWIDEITVVVADEVHLIDSPDRGPTLEIVLAKLMRQNPQIIALSATIGNAGEVAKWLNAALVLSDWRPTQLKEGVFSGKAIIFGDRSTREVKAINKESAITLSADTLIEGGQCLVFESSRKNTEGLAARIGDSITSRIQPEIKEQLKKIAVDILESSEVETAKKLAMCVNHGSAFHHAGLITEQRKLIEDGFRKGLIKVIVATPTLAAGLNLPARRVIIKGFRRYDVNEGMVPIPVLEYKQMAGRAGRPRLDPYGESVLVAKNYDELPKLMEHYVYASPEKIWSKLGSENALRTHILSTIVTGFASNMEELIDFMSYTFYSTQQEPWGLKAVIQNIIKFLSEKKMIIEKDGLFPTQLGTLVSHLYIDPLSASTIIEGMAKIEEKGIKFTEMTLLHLISMTPDMRKLYLRTNDYKLLSDIVMAHNAEFVQTISPGKIDYEWFLSEVKTASVMLDWINERKEEDIVNKFGIGEGDIRALSETTLWLVHSMAELGRHEKRSCARAAAELENRVEYGASHELLELIHIRGIGRVRARKLYDAGFRDMEALRAGKPQMIAKIIGQKIAQKVLKQIGAPTTVEEPADEQRNLGDFGNENQD
jgi:helicase